MDNVDLFFQIFNLHGKSWILDQLMIFASTSLIYLMLLGVLFLALKGETRDRKAFLLIIVGLPVAIIIIKIIHLFLFEPRPFVTFNFTPIVPEDANASFPSRHATISAVIAFSYTYFKSKWTPFLLFIMLWIGLSRIFVGVHYPLDVLGGFTTAVLAIFISLKIKKFLEASFMR
ncbi:phosphatase PAP2 family protein [Candidatus Daviesbacteria bacterium]|nr:phosphatase PAP2 family protein [Candidatus Daviesbacteria bacterium]